MSQSNAGPLDIEVNIVASTDHVDVDYRARNRSPAAIIVLDRKGTFRAEGSNVVVEPAGPM